VSAATLNGNRVTSARVWLSASRLWYADVQIDGEVALAGAVTLVVADLTLRGTVLSGGPAKGRSSFRLVAGAGGWGRDIPKKPYANDAGVKVATVLGDAAAAVGETLATVDPALRVGPGFARKAGPASRVLELVSPGGWYVDELGVTRLGARAAGTLPAGVTHGPVDRARGTVTLASEKIAAILPGVAVDGLVAVDVMHEITATGGLRSTIYGVPAGAAVNGALDSMRRIIDQLDPNRAFRGVTEYRVVTASGKRLNLQAVLASSGMPDLPLVPVRPGVPGADCSAAALGSRVLVGFVNSDPSRPYVAGFEDADGAGFLPTSLTLLGGTAGIVRVGDEVTISALQFAAASPSNGSGPVTITSPMKGSVSTGSSKVTCG
jgi:hypothetical protein